VALFRSGRVQFITVRLSYILSIICKRILIASLGPKSGFNNFDASSFLPSENHLHPSPMQPKKQSHGNPTKLI
jgi:hypothetical protein